MCYLCEARREFPPTTWEIEFFGGPYDGRTMTVNGAHLGIPVERIRLAIQSVLTYLPAVANVNDTMPSQLVYDRGDSINDDTHRWPYIYAGTVH
jgi:hypothetical protein